MQIKAITVNAASLASPQGIQVNRNQAQPEDNMFGTECKVTISKEGRNLSRQQASRTEKGTQDIQNSQSVKAERMLLRRQEQAEQDKKIRDGYREELKEIEDKISSLNSSYPSLCKVGDDAIEKEQEVRRAMRNQKQAQMDENQKRAKEARQMAMQSAEYQEEIDEGNRDLLTLLKTMEEAEKAEDEQESGKAGSSSDGSDGGASGAQRSVSEVIEGSATQFMTSSVKREWSVEELLTQLGDDGRELLMRADSITRKVLDTVDGIRKAMDDELYTTEQIDELMRLLKDGDTDPGTVRALRASHNKTGMDLNYDDVYFSRRDGLYLLRKAREHKLENIASDPLRGMQDTKKSMMASSVDATLGEARQNSLDKVSQELEDEVKKLIDERNDADTIRHNQEEEQEEQTKKAEEEQEQTKKEEQEQEEEKV